MSISNLCPNSPILETNSKLVEEGSEENGRCLEDGPFSAPCHEIYLIFCLQKVIINLE